MTHLKPQFFILVIILICHGGPSHGGRPIHRNLSSGLRKGGGGSNGGRPTHQTLSLGPSDGGVGHGVQAMKNALLIKFYLHAGPSDGGVGHGVPSHKGHLTHQILSPCRSKSWWSRPWCAKP
jgi:hypothetical protein